MKKTLLTNLKFIAFGIALAISISYAYAAYWNGSDTIYSDPTTTPSAGNLDTPINVSALDQIKIGGLSLKKSFWALKAAQFTGQTFLSGVLGAGTNGSFPNSSTVRFGGIDLSGNKQIVPITMSGGLGVSQALAAASLVNSAGTSTICSDQNGKVVLCDAPATVCPNVAGGPYTTVPPGYQQNPDGTCGKAPKQFLASIAYQKFDSYPALYGNVSGGLMQNHVGQPPGVSPIPLADSIGIYNGPSGCESTTGCNEWISNQIPAVKATSFSPSGALLIDGAEAGTYNFSIISSLKLGIIGKYPDDVNLIGADLYLRICNVNSVCNNYPNSAWDGQWIAMDGDASTYSHEQYPVTGDTKMDFAKYLPYGGDRYSYTDRYNLNFQKTLQLGTGDKVYIYALIYGSSYRSAASFNRFSYSIDASSTQFKIIETGY
jgi:hypothetical protein